MQASWFSTFKLRPPCDTDYADIASWIGDAKACARWAGAQFPYPFTVGGLPELLCIRDGTSFVLCQGDGSALGFAQYKLREARTAHLARIILAPHARGRGLGKLMCRLLIDEALRATNAHTLTLRVYRDNPAAQTVYSSLGFLAVEDGSDTEVLFMKRVVEQ